MVSAVVGVTNSASGGGRHGRSGQRRGKNRLGAAVAAMAGVASDGKARQRLEWPTTGLGQGAGAGAKLETGLVSNLIP